MITQQELTSIFHYNKRTGVFTHKLKKYNWRDKKEVGHEITDSRRKTSYLRTRINGKDYLLHRLAWLYVYGELPEIIDHKDGNGLNNKISNLRASTQQENNRNVRCQERNKTGVKNVIQEKGSNKFRVSFTVKKDGDKSKTVSFGKFDTIEEASFVAKNARSALHGDFANHKKAKNTIKQPKKKR